MATIRHRFFFVVLASVLVASIAMAEQVKLTWDPNTESDLAGYRIHIGTSSGSYTRIEDAGNPTPTEYVVNGLIMGQTYYFAATAYDTANNESGYSNEVSYTVPVVDKTPPDPPTGLKTVEVTINLSTGEVSVLVRESPT